jgi:hypothetical protein
MAKRKHETDLASAASAPFFIMGHRTLEWSHDMRTYHSIEFQSCESFGEYASKCFAGGAK